MERLIHRISAVTPQGANSYFVGQTLKGGVVAKITNGELYFQGDPYDHYIGYDENNKMLFSINCLTPCDIEYN